VAAPPIFPGLGPEPRPVSVTEPVSRAFEITRGLLFPINLGKWFTLGFVAWIANLGEGAGSSFNIPDTSGRGGGGGPGIKPAVDWVLDNLGLVVLVTVAVLAVGIAIGVALTWVSSRGKLMFVHCIARDEAKVEEPWRRYAARGKDLFIVRLYLGIAGFVVALVGIALGLWLAFDDLRAGTFAGGALWGLVVGLGVILIGSIPLGIAGALLEDFVVPSMYLHDEPVRPAWDRVKSEVIDGNVGTIVLFYLMKLALGVGVGVIAVAATCITCCLAGLPYLGTVMLLPLIVFMRAYALCFIEQFGEQWRFFAPPSEPFESGFSGP
jgi:hypothetical protein